MNYINLDNLPKDKRGRVKWKYSIGYIVNFSFNNIEGFLKIKDYNIDTRRLVVEYDNYTNSISTNAISDCKLHNIVNKKDNISTTRWTDLELEILKNNYSKMNKYELGKLIPNKTIEAISAKGLRLGLHKNKENKKVPKLKNLNNAFIEYKEILYGYKYRFSNNSVKKYMLPILFKYYLRKNNIKTDKESLLNYKYKQLLIKSKLENLIKKYYNGYYDFICECFPNYGFKVWEFTILDCPNNYWSNKYNMFHCIRDSIKYMFDNNIINNYNDIFIIPNNKLISIFHSSVKYFQDGLIGNIINYLKFCNINFTIDKFYDNQLFDSVEEIEVYKELKKVFPFIKKNKDIKFYNSNFSESYIPDFVIDNVVIEYFGMYKEDNSNSIFVEYRNKAKRKIDYFTSIKDVTFIGLYPKDLYNNNIVKKILNRMEGV